MLAGDRTGLDRSPKHDAGGMATIVAAIATTVTTTTDIGSAEVRPGAANGLLETEDRRDYRCSDKPRNHRPTRDGSRSLALYPAERMLPIPLRFIIEPHPTIIRHREHRIKIASPGRNYLTVLASITASTIY
jgi:hypothetical protein